MYGSLRPRTGTRTRRKRASCDRTYSTGCASFRSIPPLRGGAPYSVLAQHFLKRYWAQHREARGTPRSARRRGTAAGAAVAGQRARAAERDQACRWCSGGNSEIRRTCRTRATVPAGLPDQHTRVLREMRDGTGVREKVADFEMGYLRGSWSVPTATSSRPHRRSRSHHTLPTHEARPPP